MTISDCRGIHELLALDLWPDAANYVLGLLGKPATCTTKVQAVKILQGLFQHLLDKDLYLQAATLQWGPDVFQTEPDCTKRVFKALHEGSRILLQGASSMSKTYAAGAWMVLDYLRD